MYMSTPHLSCLQTHQKMSSNPMRDGWEPPCGCWEMNSGLLEEQSVLLTAEPSQFFRIPKCSKNACRSGYPRQNLRSLLLLLTNRIPIPAP